MEFSTQSTALVNSPLGFAPAQKPARGRSFLVTTGYNRVAIVGFFKQVLGEY